MKFGDLSVEKTWEAFKVLKGKRLTGSFGLLWGVKIPDTMTDDMPDEDLPYLEMLYKFAFSKKSYYDLVMTRQVEPQAKIDRMSEEEATTDRHDMREMERGRKRPGEDGGRWGPTAPPAARTQKTTLENPTTDTCSGSATNPKMGRIFI